MSTAKEEYKIASNKYDKYLIILIVSLGFGDFGSPLLLSRILALLFLPNLLQLIGKCSYIKNIKTFFIVVTAYSIFSLTWSFNLFDGLKGIVYNLIHFILFLEFLVFCQYANKPLKSISVGWTFVLFCLSMISIWEFVTGNHMPLAYDETQQINVGGSLTQRMVANATFANYNAFIKFLCFALPWVFYRLTTTINEKFKFLTTLIILIFAILIIFIDGSRGGLFSVLVIFCVYVCFMPKGRASFLTLLLLVGILLYVLLEYGEQIFLVLSMKREDHGLASDSSRIEIWRACLRALGNSLGLGSGIGGISGAIESVSPNVIKVPHNMFIEVLLEYGLIIGLIFISFVIKLFKRGFRLCDKNRRMAVLMAIISMPLVGIIDSVYLKSPETFVFLATLFVFVNYESIKPVCK